MSILVTKYKVFKTVGGTEPVLFYIRECKFLTAEKCGSYFA